MDFFVATKNLKKLAEIERILAPLGIKVLCERDFDLDFPEVEEDGETFRDNALIKAEAGMKITGLPTIADDSGLCVDALDGEPGVYSARYAGEPCDNHKNNLKLLDALKEVPDQERTARFVSSIACVFPDGRKVFADGKVEGKIAFDMRGTRGFGYDVLFISELGYFAEITDEEKDSISHRGRALRLLKEKLTEILGEK